MNPRFPVYIVSKGRADTRQTSRALEGMGVPYYIVVEAQERAAYAQHISGDKILVLDQKFQREYDTFDDLGDSKSRGPGPARNFAWEHSRSIGADWHWVMDDNITFFARLNRNLKVPVADGTIFHAMEEFVLRYTNVGMAGPNYWMFAPRKTVVPPFTINTRIYSCNLIRNALPLRWRGRYNEDTDLSLRMLKAGWCTVQFNAFLQYKLPTQTVKGGNTAEFYAREGTLPKSRMQVAMHPDVSKLVWKFGRWHHSVDYSSFTRNRLVRREDAHIPSGVENYGMELKRGHYGGRRPGRAATEGDRGEGVQPASPETRAAAEGGPHPAVDGARQAAATRDDDGVHQVLAEPREPGSHEAEGRRSAEVYPGRSAPTGVRGEARRAGTV